MLAVTVFTGNQLKFINDVFRTVTQGTIELKILLTDIKSVFKRIVGYFDDDG